MRVEKRRWGLKKNGVKLGYGVDVASAGRDGGGEVPRVSAVVGGSGQFER